MPFVVHSLPDNRYRSCFREVHSKIGVLVISVLNTLTFCMLVVQTLLSFERSQFDLFFIVLQGTVILSTVFALLLDTRFFLFLPILFWMAMALCTLILILFAVLYVIYPNGFPARFNLLINHHVLEEGSTVIDTDKIAMVRGVAVTGILMLIILFFVFLWFVGIHRKCFRYMGEVTSGQLIPADRELRCLRRPSYINDF